MFTHSMTHISTLKLGHHKFKKKCDKNSKEWGNCPSPKSQVLRPKSKSQIQVPNPKSKVQRKGDGTGADNIILQAWNVNPVMGKDHPWPSLTFHDLLWPSMIKCLLSRPGLISGPLQSSPAQINSQSNPRLDPIDSKSSESYWYVLFS